MTSSAAPEHGGTSKPVPYGPFPADSARMKRQQLRIVFDGGALGNPGLGYGSYQIIWGDRPPQLHREEFGPRLTNNEAEYLALIRALEYAVAAVEAAGVDPTSIVVEVRGDSRLVLKQVAGEWKVRAPHLQHLRDAASDLLRRFGGSNLSWHPRSESVRILGH